MLEASVGTYRSANVNTCEYLILTCYPRWHISYSVMLKLPRQIAPIRCLPCTMLSTDCDNYGLRRRKLSVKYVCFFYEVCSVKWRPSIDRRCAIIMVRHRILFGCSVNDWPTKQVAALFNALVITPDVASCGPSVVMLVSKMLATTCVCIHLLLQLRLLWVE